MPENSTYTSQLPEDWPKWLPRFAESFRIIIDHPQWGMRMLSSEWEYDHSWSKIREDYCPLLARAGGLGFVASTSPPGIRSPFELQAYYGDQNFPVINWYWNKGAWECAFTEAYCQRYCDYRKISMELLNWPAGEPVPHHLRAL